ncbi:MAG: AbrB/MazE/SpoVT family DNA-binding domain-containing protein [Candidatus Omnitrophica bacterium]|nr:AbrB/MazE/SpoVT family DNA-binding domain-containing protein [Candidatus Omnitrophota bacterium]MCA9437983.1 AbrB/MazE/SpoVT family DNA-binding domain-containing protein [Candidatus Omnitrophota bacterium]MCA9442855.1 AbrB/MazE/SpoVT family DNA-binding domain-containing protein [Candidatus Omnitrophota bacterium]
MSTLGTTRMSSKGQVVIPEKIRKALHLEPGSEFTVVAVGDTVMLKMIEPPSMEEMEGILERSRQYAKEKGLKPSDVEKAIRDVREEKRRKGFGG